MAVLDLALKSGVKLIGEAGTAVKRAEVNGHVIQEAISKGQKVKVVTFAEGSPMHKLGITDSVYYSGSGQIKFLKNPKDIMSVGEKDVNRGSWDWKDYLAAPNFSKFIEKHKYEIYEEGRIFLGPLEKAKTFIESIRELVSNGGKIS